MNYTVTFNEKPLPSFINKFLYRDETVITDNKTKEIIGFNQRIMKIYTGLTAGLAVGYYYSDAVCGDWYRMYLKTFHMLEWRLHGFGDHKIDLNRKLYNKYTKGEK